MGSLAETQMLRIRQFRFALFRVAEDKISASIVDTVLAKVAAEERGDGNRRQRRQQEELQGRKAVEAATTSGQQGLVAVCGPRNNMHGCARECKLKLSLQI